MQILVTEQQFQKLFEQEEKAFSTPEITLFKNLNKKKFELRNEAALKDYIKRVLKFFNIPTDDYHKYFLTYVNNYREDGRYELTTKDELKFPVDTKLQSTTNIKSDLFTKNQIPFKSSNLKGFWEYDPNKQYQYVVLSYDWYPIFLYKNGKWYEAKDGFSNSTKKQIINARPTYDTIRVSTGEMKDMRNGGSGYEDKFEEIFEKCKGLIGKELTALKRRPNKSTVYQINSMVRENDTIVVNVELFETDDNFRNFGDPESMIEALLLPKLKNLIGPELDITNLFKFNVTYLG